MRLLTRKKIILSLIAVIPIYFIGLTHEYQWSADTGRDRYLRRVYGIPISISKPKETDISKWIRSRESEGNWFRVYKSHPLSELNTNISYAFLYAKRHLRGLDFFIKNPKERERYTKFFLEKLAREGDIYWFADFEQFEYEAWQYMNRIGDLDADGKTESSLTFEQMKSLWENFGS